MTGHHKLLLLALLTGLIALVDQRFATLSALLFAVAGFYKEYTELKSKLRSAWTAFTTANERFFSGVKFLVLVLPAFAFWSAAMYLLFNELANFSVSFGNGQWFSTIPKPVIIAYVLLGAAYVWVMVSKRLQPLKNLGSELILRDKGTALRGE